MIITEVSNMFNISVDTLRYYERIGLLPPVKRNSSGYREYSEQDCNWVFFVKNMRNAGISVEALVEYVNLFQQGDSTIPSRKAILMEQREVLEKRAQEILSTLDRLDKKIEVYEEHIVKFEQKLQQEPDPAIR